MPFLLKEAFQRLRDLIEIAQTSPSPIKLDYVRIVSETGLRSSLDLEIP
jgi:hypothetical protein